MSANKPVSARKLGSDLKRVDAHVIQTQEYEDLPELTDEMLIRAKVNKGGRPKLANTRKLISLRLPEEVINKWRATGPGWQTRMAKHLEDLPQ
ncbi:BrnA antitoxin family protein [Nitrosomonas sp.]|uniref:BrnA antitoxin family protein n=1 Tax=Nitrosomonas sp. TaxID=42353 RepID=UPI002636A31F|nr:BrnA antitoxin family protein [Nitrosomonas sp.]